MSENANVYKDTLNLPKTSFDMKANLLTKEPAIQAKWQKEDLYGMIRHARLNAPRFILHDGPPFANGNIHLGHALNKVLKDMVIRTKTMAGMDAPYIPGWDCHGQPIEQKIVDNLGEKAATLPAHNIRRRCQEYAAKFVKLQSTQFQRLGIMGEWENPYITMAPQYEADVLEVFARLVEQKLVYRQLRPVHWSIENRTALADAELEYHDRNDTSIYVLFPLTTESAEKVPHKSGDRVNILIWTTTPWTLPANLAAAVHPDFEYAVVHADTAEGGMTFLIARPRLDAVMAAVNAGRPGWIKSHEVIATMTGREMLAAELKYNHPLRGSKICPVVPANYVTLEDGSGVVHTAPGHGMEDYGTALKQGLEIYCPVKADGTFDDTAPAWLVGKSVWQGNPAVVEYLTKNQMLMLSETITHSYPHDWRSKTPTIFRATEQWFIAVDRKTGDGGRSLRDLAMDACRRDPAEGGIKFVPDWGRNRIAGMLESRPDWCISRQRAWGLPIPAFYNAKGQSLLTPATVRAVSSAFAKLGSDSWFIKTPAELLEGYDPAHDPDLKNPADFPVADLTKGNDILDVWFESGSSWNAVAVRRGLVADIPVDMYLEGSDQHRGWFQLSLLPALGARGKAPFKTILTHGWVMDEEGKKMSKSIGNTIDVVEQMGKRGADIIRLWAAAQNYHDDVNCSEKLILQAEDAYRKIRNTLRYCMSACSDFDPAHHSIEPSAHSIDRWMELEMHRLIRDVRSAFDTYDFFRATRILQEFCVVKASAVYFSAIKDRLYCEAPNSPRRRATQTVVHQLLVAMVKLLAPIIPHTCEEAWEHIPFRDTGEPKSVHLADLPDYDQAMLNEAETLHADAVDAANFSLDSIHPCAEWVWDRLLDLRSAGQAKLDALRNSTVKNSLDAEAVFQVAANDNGTAKFIEAYLPELEDMLGVGYARLERVTAMPEGKKVNVEVLDAREKYQRCARSWKRRPDVGSDPEYTDLSARDAAAVREMKK